MARINAGDLTQKTLVEYVLDLRARVKALELQVGMRAVTFSPLLTAVSGTAFETVAFTVFPRSGSSLAVDVNASAALEVQATVDGIPIGPAATTSAAGAVTLQGFLPDTWAFGDRKRVEIKARRPSGTGSVTVTVLGGWHR
ncbi:hypothetical protein ETD86_12920 [Nonomuraea turkmeniaca]|uniref:Uncharacterized protein n=1 Tax=Nonomuraea turkmeniaca TaxID=103838 RepID=A0A5S4FNN9_9ACTN|nr:hypothetical protein [Nonomuraea turkmeniaca]TMR22064.1 hypothetical protein ETD86_12920 [Nonomuraea turkmeniaca]